MVDDNEQSDTVREMLCPLWPVTFLVHCMRQCKHTIGIRTLAHTGAQIINEIWEPLASPWPRLSQPHTLLPPEAIVCYVLPLPYLFHLISSPGPWCAVALLTLILKETQYEGQSVEKGAREKSAMRAEYVVSFSCKLLMAKTYAAMSWSRFALLFTGRKIQFVKLGQVNLQS